MDLIELSKIVSHALRHNPQLYGIGLDAEGWVGLSDLVQAFKNNGIDISQDDIVQMLEKSDKKRHQILNGKIRACYGHSLNEKLIKKIQCPPSLLYHGTMKRNIANIIYSGLLPMKRQYVHLSEDEEIAKSVAIRRNGEFVILKIKSYEAYQNGVIFYKEENNIWLSEQIPSTYIEF